jgi:hypothetical protein
MTPQRCTHTTAQGAPCKAWAIRNSEPPACASHAGRTGAPQGNQSARRHGFYSPVIEEDELADLVALGDNITLEDEIALCRVAIRRLAASLQAEGKVKQADLERIASLMFAGARTVARLLRDKRIISNEAATALSSAMNAALDWMNEQYPKVEI